MDRKRDRTSLVFWWRISASKIKLMSCNLFRRTSSGLVKSELTCYFSLSQSEMKEKYWWKRWAIRKRTSNSLSQSLSTSSLRLNHSNAKIGSSDIRSTCLTLGKTTLQLWSTNLRLQMTMKALWRVLTRAAGGIEVSQIRLGRGVELQLERHLQFNSATMMMDQDVELLKLLSQKWNPHQATLV